MAVAVRQSIYSALLHGTPCSRTTLALANRGGTVSACEAESRAQLARKRFEDAQARRMNAAQAAIDSTLALVRASNPGFKKVR